MLLGQITHLTKSSFDETDLGDQEFLLYEVVFDIFFNVVEERCHVSNVFFWSFAEIEHICVDQVSFEAQLTSNSKQIAHYLLQAAEPYAICVSQDDTSNW